MYVCWLMKNVFSLVKQGTRIAERRTELGFTQTYAAELAGMSRRTLQLIESGEANPTLRSLLSLLDVLGLEITIVKRLTDENQVR